MKPAWDSKLWCTEELDEDGDIHVYPLDDRREHTLDNLCPCRPFLEIDSFRHIYIHNSWDFREIVEELNEESAKGRLPL
jgi:hypothetical protein